MSKNPVIRFFTSLALTIACLTFAMILVFIGTLEQVKMGIYAVQKIYFASWFLWWSPGADAGFSIPVFPGGYLIGTLLLVNLLAAHAVRFKFTWKKSGIFLLHLGVLLLLVGQLLTMVYSEEGQMALDEGQSKNYSESFTESELAIIDTSASDHDKVVAIPLQMLHNGAKIQDAALPFLIEVKQFFPNAELHMRTGPESGDVEGVGKRVGARQVPMTYKPNEANSPTAYLEFKTPESSLGTWMVSTYFSMPQFAAAGIPSVQTVKYRDVEYKIELRPKRYYKPYSLHLVDFTHEKYAGTEIAQNFSSRVQLLDASQHENREVLIYMNNPLRYRGETYYQASFANNDRTSILQVVKNPSWLLPYVSCALVTLGLMVQFSIHLFGFARRRSS